MDDQSQGGDARAAPPLSATGVPGTSPSMSARPKIVAHTKYTAFSTKLSATPMPEHFRTLFPEHLHFVTGYPQLLPCKVMEIHLGDLYNPYPDTEQRSLMPRSMGRYPDTRTYIRSGAPTDPEFSLFGVTRTKQSCRFICNVTTRCPMSRSTPRPYCFHADGVALPVARKWGTLWTAGFPHTSLL